MDTIQAQCFRLFVEMGPGRSIPKLAKLCAENDMNVTERMLKRWSIKFHWHEAAKKTTEDVAQRVEEEMIEDQASRSRKLITGLRRLQDRFIEKIAIDPNDPKLSDEERRRALDPDFRDFQDAVKLERLIMGDPTERREDVMVTRLQLELGPNELLEAARQIASRRYGLPSDDEIAALQSATIEGETVEQ